MTTATTPSNPWTISLDAWDNQYVITYQLGAKTCYVGTQSNNTSTARIKMFKTAAAATKWVAQHYPDKVATLIYA